MILRLRGTLIGKKPFTLIYCSFINIGYKYWFPCIFLLSTFDLNFMDWHDNEIHENQSQRILMPWFTMSQIKYNKIVKFLFEKNKVYREGHWWNQRRVLPIGLLRNLTKRDGNWNLRHSLQTIADDRQKSALTEILNCTPNLIFLHYFPRKSSLL